MQRRPLGACGIEVSAIGLGGWSIAGPCFRGDEPLGYSGADDAESIRAIRRAIELGIDFFDTSDMYGCGHGERLLGAALRDRRDRVRIATKFGYRIDEAARQITGHRELPAELSAACEASLRRLGVDTIDLYLLHLRDFASDRASEVFDALAALVAAGKIRAYGWSTDDPQRARRVADHGGSAVEQAFNVLQGDPATLALCEERGLASIQRSPLAMGFLAASRDRRAPPRDDVRAAFDPLHGRARPLLERARRLDQLFAASGRTRVQCALGFLLANSACAIPIPGFRSVAQVEEIAAVLSLPPLAAELVEAIRSAALPRDLPPDPWQLRG